MSEPTEVLTALSSEKALTDRIALQERQIRDALAKYEPVSATLAWFDTLRAVEECINLITVDWDDQGLERDLFSLSIIDWPQDPNRFVAVRQRLIERFGENFGARFTNLLIQGASIAAGFAHQGFLDLAAAFQTIATTIDYLQSRRRHFVGLLHMLPTACRGRQVVTPLDTFAIFLPIVELTTVQMVSAHYALIIKLARASLGLPENQPTQLAMLDSLYLEPERARITEMLTAEQSPTILASLEALRSDRIFSAAELRNEIRMTEAAYAEFDLASTDFAVAAALVRRLSTEFIDRDFWIAISPADLTALWKEFDVSPALRSALVHTVPTYMACVSTYAPFVLIDGVYRSTVTLLSRFMYHWRAKSLERRKRFQIRAGFIFEDAVAEELTKQGFGVQGIKRINRHEFDVVTLRQGVIWNVQCKNNFVDLVWIEADPGRFARYNRNLVRSYEKALTKELNRQDLLKRQLSINRIQHMVVSRFPVVSDNPRILPFSRIDTFSARADALLPPPQD